MSGGGGQEIPNGLRTAVLGFGMSGFGVCARARGVPVPRSSARTMVAQMRRRIAAFQLAECFGQRKTA